MLGSQAQGILLKWEQLGIDTAYVELCIELANLCESRRRQVVEFRKHGIKSWQKERKDLKNMIRLVEQDPYYSSPREQEEDIRKFNMHLLFNLMSRPGGYGRIMKKFDHMIYLGAIENSVMELHKILGIPYRRQKSSLEDFGFLPLDVPLTLIYNHLLKTEGEPAYGRESTLSRDYLQDLYDFFHQISPDNFPPSLCENNFNTLSKRISDTRKNCPYLAELERNLKRFLEEHPRRGDSR